MAIGYDFPTDAGNPTDCAAGLSLVGFYGQYDRRGGNIRHTIVMV